MSTMESVYLGRLGPRSIMKDLAQLVWTGNNKHIAFRDEGGPAWEADTDMEGGCTAFGSVVPCGL